MRIVLANIQRTVILGAMNTEGFGEDLGTDDEETILKMTPLLGTSPKSFCSHQQTAEEAGGHQSEFCLQQGSTPHELPREDSQTKQRGKSWKLKM